MKKRRTKPAVALARAAVRTTARVGITLSQLQQMAELRSIEPPAIEAQPLRCDRYWRVGA